MSHYSLYIHIPFCKKKCPYCDFHSFAGREGEIDAYVEKISAEIRSLLTAICLPLTIYLGGGTPSLLNPGHLKKIFSPLLSAHRFPLTAVEISMEANPGTVSLPYLRELRALGINRFSLGAQSFNDKHLKTLGRIHTAKEIYQAVEDARKAGFENINLDLMYALPGQTLDELKRDIKEALSLAPEHLSVYNLQIEEGTPLAQITNIKCQIPNEETEVEMFEHVIDQLTSQGYEHYEISNFAKPGFRCQHNVNYWKNGNWIGIGDGAKSNEDREGKNTLFLGLRMLEGLPKEKFTGYENEVAELMKDGLLTKDHGNYKLSRRGLFLANQVFEKFV